MENLRTGKSISQRVAWLRGEAIFKFRPPDWSTIISLELQFGADANEFFTGAIQGCQTYLEFGSGSSTFAAHSKVNRLVSVDSDENFLKAVETLMLQDKQEPFENKSTFIHVNIGATGTWGAPLVRVKSESRKNRWSAYPLAPWSNCGRDFRADLILVDGRFRVACALAVAVLQEDSQWTLLVDDYIDRSEYWVLEEFLDLRGMHGRMAEFAPSSTFDSGRARIALDKYLSDFR